MITVGLDIRATRPGFRAHFGRGTGRYTTELAARLLGREEEGVRVEPLEPDQLKGSALEESLLKILPLGKQTAHTQFILPRQIKRLPFQALHFPSHGDATARCPLPFSVTVLDLIPLRFPEMYKPKHAGWRFHLARRLELDTIRAASGIFAISEAAKRDVVELLGLPPERILVTPLGVDDKFRPRTLEWRAESAAIRSKRSLSADRPIVFYFGGIDPRKNVPFLVEVFQGLLSRWNAKSPKPILVFAGGIDKDERFPGLLKQISKAGLQDDVRLLGFVPEEELLDLLAAADVLAFPSLYEGFGLPVLEAMACGLPVLAGRNSSIVEVMGRDEFLCADGRKEEWIDALEALLLKKDLQAERTEWGVKRARLFRWERTAELTLAGLVQFFGGTAAGIQKVRAGG